MIIKISPDKEKAKSLLKMAESRANEIKELDIKKFSTIVAENYYEIIKEMITAILLTKGIKATGEYAHKDLIEQALKHHFIEDFEHSLLNDLRDRRNKSQYEGRQIELHYIENNKEVLEKVMVKLRKALMQILEQEK